MKNFKEKGITLIALVIMITTLLILAGVSISYLFGQNGILTRASEAKKLSYISNEKEAIELVCTLAKMDNSLDYSNQYFLGKQLKSPKLDNVNWDIIILNNSQECYGDSWNFISKNTNISNYGATKYDWLVSYDTGEIIQLDENSFTELSSQSGLAVTDGLLFNIDAQNIYSNDISTWGDNVSLYYFDDTIYDSYNKRHNAYNEEISYGDVTKFNGYDRQRSYNAKDYIDLNKKAFKFNGNNYIEIYNKDGFDFSNGFSFEFYGNLNDLLYSFYESSFSPFLGLWNGYFDTQCDTRFGYIFNNKKLHYRLLFQAGECGSWPEPLYPYNQQYEISNFINQNIYLTLVFNPSNSDKAVQSIYINGTLLDEGWLTKAYYNAFVSRAKALDYIEIGRCTMGNFRQLVLL